MPIFSPPRTQWITDGNLGWELNDVVEYGGRMWRVVRFEANFRHEAGAKLEHELLPVKKNEHGRFVEDDLPD